MKTDLIIKNAKVFMSSRRQFEVRDIAISGARISIVAPEISICEHPCGNWIDAKGSYIIPGLIDIHMHIESSMTYPVEFSRIALPHGTTTIVADAHEIGNVFGPEGVFSFMEQKTSMDIFYAIPSSVPATNTRLETSGAEFDEKEMEELLKDDRILCLGEIMNFQDLNTDADDTKTKRLICLAQKLRGRDIRIEGHCPKLSGEDLNRFLFCGVDADHTQQTPESILEKTDLGMFLEIQRKSITPDTIRVINDNQLFDHLALVTDDTMPDLLLSSQLNGILDAAVANGMRPEDAIYCATLTPARRMHLDDRGLIGPGKLADLVFLKSPSDFHPTMVIKSGQVVYKNAETAKTAEAAESKVAAIENTNPAKLSLSSCASVNKKDLAPSFPKHFYHSIHCRKAVPDDFILKTDLIENGTVTAHVMKISTFGTMTRHVLRTLPVTDHVINWQESGLCLAVIYERYGKNGNIAYGLIEGAFTASGAAATSWSHDSHNLLVLGNSPEDMQKAQHRILELQGGYVVCSGHTVKAEAKLEIGGIISAEPLEKLAHDLADVRAAMMDLGYNNNNVIMSMSTLALPVSPELKMTDYGLLDVKTQKSVPLAELTL